MKTTTVRTAVAAGAVAAACIAGGIAAASAGTMSPSTPEVSVSVGATAVDDDNDGSDAQALDVDQPDADDVADDQSEDSADDLDEDEQGEHSDDSGTDDDSDDQGEDHGDSEQGEHSDDSGTDDDSDDEDEDEQGEHSDDSGTDDDSDDGDGDGTSRASTPTTPAPTTTATTGTRTTATPSTATTMVGATTEAISVDGAAYRGARDTATCWRGDPLTSDLEATTAAAVRGDGAALGEIYGALAPKVCGYLTVRGADDPEGLTNEVFLKVFPLVPTLTGGWDGLRTLVFSVAHARLVDDQRRRGNRGPSTTYHVEDDPRTRESAETQALSRLGHQELLDLLELLPDDQRSVVLLRVVGDLSIRQTAAAMGRAESAVVRMQSKGLATLRQLLSTRPDVQVTAQGASDRT